MISTIATLRYSNYIAIYTLIFCLHGRVLRKDLHLASYMISCMHAHMLWLYICSYECSYIIYLRILIVKERIINSYNSYKQGNWSDISWTKKCEQGMQNNHVVISKE